MSLFKNPYQYNLGYALSGGGAKGFAHLGALKALESNGLKPEIIVGTSAGALAGVLYADGYTPDEIANLFKGKEFKAFFELTLPSAGLFKTTRLKSFLENNLRAKTFEQLKIPFIAVATDWEKAKTVTFSRGGLLIDAVVASCCVPVVFYPQIINEVIYVDGGLLKNFPVSVIRNKCRYVIGINVSLMVPTPKRLNVKTMAQRTFNLMSNANTLNDRKLCDILIETKGLEKYSMFDLNNIEHIAEIGNLCAYGKMGEIGSKEIIRKYKKYQSSNRKLHAK